jgi:hypothetical protein
LRVSAFEAVQPKPANIANQPKCSFASSADFDTTGRLKFRPMASAIARNGTPSSATPWKRSAGVVESPSQFSREYARLFGAPPGRDSAVLRSAFS